MKFLSVFSLFIAIIDFTQARKPEFSKHAIGNYIIDPLLPFFKEINTNLILDHQNTTNEILHLKNRISALEDAQNELAIKINKTENNSDLQDLQFYNDELLVILKSELDSLEIDLKSIIDLSTSYTELIEKLTVKPGNTLKKYKIWKQRFSAYFSDIFKAYIPKSIPGFKENGSWKAILLAVFCIVLFI